MPTLTDAEKQEVLRCLEADKPLPDKYRFLLFDDKREVELVWNGKSGEVTNVVLPFQTIECVDEPRLEAGEEPKAGRDTELLFSLDDRGRQLRGWTNKLIWGDNKLVLSSLKNGPMREEIEKQGGIKLIYIDPPFDVGADFSMDIEVGDGGDTFTKRPNILEEIAYRDTWGKGADSFISMIYERLILMRDLLAEDGSIYVHMGPKINHFVRSVLDEVFGESNSQRELIWKRVSARGHGKAYPATHDSILFYSKGESFIWNQQFLPLSKEYVDSKYRFSDPDGRKYRKDNCLNQNANRPNLTYEWNGHVRTWSGLPP
jgi:adenine specific DNA methylase Mod